MYDLDRTQLWYFFNPLHVSNINPYIAGGAFEFQKVCFHCLISHQRWSPQNIGRGLQRPTNPAIALGVLGVGLGRTSQQYDRKAMAPFAMDQNCRAPLHLHRDTSIGALCRQPE